MKRYLAICWLLCLGTLLWGQESSVEYMEGQLYVKLRITSVLEFKQFRSGDEIPRMPDSPEFSRILQQYGASDLFRPFRTQSPHIQRIYQISFSATDRTSALIAELQALPYIEYAERIPIYRQHYSPNDLSFLQWHLPMIRAEQAWDYATGSPEIVVAIVDDAILLDHEDLAPRIWTNPGEIPGDSIDNDGNGYIDDVNGYDLADDDPDANPPAAANNNRFSHGTHVAGIAAAATDNGTGIASIGFNLSILPVKTKQDTSLSTNALQATLMGVDYAIATGADVVNMSFGSSSYNSSFDYLIRAGADSGMVFVASAGNTGQFSAFYPANYQDVISVASTDAFDQKSGFSTYHWNVDVSAPGSAIYSCTAGSNSSYGFKSGTSMSSPLVAGLIGLMRSVDTLMGPADLLRCLQNSADSIDAQNPNYAGWLGSGRINAQNAMACMLPLANGQAPFASQLQLHSVYSNADRTSLDVAAAVPYAGHLRIQLRDLQGRELGTVFEGMADAGEFTHRSALPRQLAIGIYLLVWEFEGQREVQKLRF